MQKAIFVLRHSNASHTYDGEDHDRKLTPKGLKKIELLAQELTPEGFLVNKVLCSTATRAKDTILKLSNELEKEFNMLYDKQIYFGNINDLWNIIQSQEESINKIAIVGHNPTLSYLVSALMNQYQEIKPCGLATIYLNDLPWNEIKEGSGSSMKYYYPDVKLST